MRYFLTIPLLTGCLAQVDVDVDPDGDGLTDAEEAELGTDRVAADSDGDGFADGDEIDDSTDPNGYWSRPYDKCRDSITSTGAEVGAVSADFSGTDQFGDEAHLYDYCEHVVLLVNAGYT